MHMNLMLLPNGNTLWADTIKLEIDSLLQLGCLTSVHLVTSPA
jgi:hypothetical protein